jgi:radical SAM protein with 4Fe4S-binding SPASM domain
MLYPGTLDLVEAATRLRLPTSIATNGTGIAKAAERLAAAPLFLLQVSVDGPTAEIHNRLRPSAGGGDNFADVTAGIRAVRAARAARGTALPLIATLTTISRGNAGSLAAIYERFRAEADLMVFYLAWWIDEPAALAHEREFGRRFGFTPVLHRGWLRTDRPDDWETLDREIARVERAAAHSGGAPAVFLPRIAGAEDLKAYYTDHARTFGFDRCISIFQAVEVNSNGDVSPCRDYHDYVVGNLREQTLADLWNCGRYRAFRTSLTREGLMPACTRCCGLMGY